MIRLPPFGVFRLSDETADKYAKNLPNTFFLVFDFFVFLNFLVDVREHFCSLEQEQELTLEKISCSLGVKPLIFYLQDF